MFHECSGCSHMCAFHQLLNSYSNAGSNLTAAAIRFFFAKKRLDISFAQIAQTEPRANNQHNHCILLVRRTQMNDKHGIDPPILRFAWLLRIFQQQLFVAVTALWLALRMLSAFWLVPLMDQLPGCCKPLLRASGAH